MLNLKDFLEKEVMKLKINNKDDLSGLITITLFIIYNKPYFKGRFKDFFIFENQKRRIISPVFNNVSGASKLKVSNFICQNTSDEKTDDFFDPDKTGYYYLKGSQRRNILSFYKAIKETNNLKSFKNNFKQYALTNGEALYDFELIFNNLADPEKYPFYNFLSSYFQVNDFKHDLHSIHFKKRGQIKKADCSGINHLNFKKNRYNYCKLIRKEILKINKVNVLIKDNQLNISKLLKSVYQKYPILQKEVILSDIDNLKYYFYEVPAQKLNKNNTVQFIKENNKLSNKGFEKINYNFNFIDHLYFNPFAMNLNNKDIFNALEGLVYVNDMNIKNTSTFNQFFIVAKNKHEETVGVLSLHQPSDLRHFSKIGEISIKYNYRNLGLAKKLYSKMAELCINNNLIVTNCMYSSMGLEYLPKMKQKVIDENPELLMLNSNFGDVYKLRDLNICIQGYNQILIEDVEQNERMNNFDIIEFKNNYKLGLKYIMEESNYSHFCSHTTKKEALHLYHKKKKP